MKVLSLFLLFFAFSHCYSQSSADCERFKNGTVYIYPKNSYDKYKVVRENGRQTEYDLKTGDLTVYTVKWDPPCGYSLSFLSTSEKKSQEELDVLKKTKLEFHIESATPTYYTYKSYFQKVPDRKAEDRYMTNDTAWLQPVDNPNNKVIFEPLKEIPAYLKKRFRDTSSYAIVYFYRETKFAAMMNEYFVYCDNQFIFWARNKTKSAVKIVNPGPVRLHAKSGTVTSTLNVTFEPGKKYYVKCIIHHRLSRAIPELKLVDKAEGELEYEDIQ